jgi:hypothetical protein
MHAHEMSLVQAEGTGRQVYDGPPPLSGSTVPGRYTEQYWPGTHSMVPHENGVGAAGQAQPTPSCFQVPEAASQDQT